MILMLVSCFLSLSRLDEMSYGTFHVQYGFKNKVTTRILFRLTKECDTTIRNTSCFFLKRKTTMDCFLFISLFGVLIFYPKVNCPSSRTLEMREILRVFHRKRAVGVCNSPNRCPRPASYFRARAGI